jgi:hypothetical protein
MIPFIVMVALLLLLLVHRYLYSPETFADSRDWKKAFAREWNEDRIVKITGERPQTIASLTGIPAKIGGREALALLLDQLGLEPSLGVEYFIDEWNQHWKRLKDKRWLDYLISKWSTNDPEVVRLRRVFPCDARLSGDEALDLILKRLDLTSGSTFQSFKEALISHIESRRRNSAKRVTSRDKSAPSRKVRSGKSHGYLTGDSDDKNFQKTSSTETPVHKRALSATKPTYLCSREKGLILCRDASGLRPVLSRDAPTASGSPEYHACLLRRGRFDCHRLGPKAYHSLIKKSARRSEGPRSAEPFQLTVEQNQYDCRYSPEESAYHCQCRSRSRQFSLPSWLAESRHLTPPSSLLTL